MTLFENRGIVTNGVNLSFIGIDASVAPCSGSRWLFVLIYPLLEWHIIFKILAIINLF